MKEIFFSKDAVKILKFFSVGMKRFMSREKINSETIASILGVSVSSVNSWRYGRNFPDVPNLIRLLELGLALSDFLPSALRCIVELNENKSEIFYLSKYIEEHKICKTEIEASYKEHCLKRLDEIRAKNKDIESELKDEKEIY